MRLSRAIASALLLFAYGLSAAAQEQAARPAKLMAPREFLELFDIDAKSLAVFVDGQPLDDAQRQQMLSILYRLRQYPLAAVDQYSKNADALAQIVEHPAESRGELFTLAGRVTRVERIPLADQQRERLQFDAYYRCTMETGAGQPAVICALNVPSAWKLDEPIDVRAGARAMFLKVLPGSPDAADGADLDTNADGAGDGHDRGPGPLLFVARRVAWYPEDTLGQLGMDAGLFDDVRDRTELDERECFYQLLAAVRRANTEALNREARSQLAVAKDVWRQQADDRQLDARQRSAARRALSRAAEGASDVAPLFNDPASQRGKLVTLRGVALRAIEVRVDDPDIVSRFGIRRYYEVEILTDDSQNNPIVCCVAQLPEGMPLGERINVGVRVTGFFLKSWAYSAGHADDRGPRQLAPLVIAGTLTWLPEPAPIGPSVTLAAALAAALAVAVLVMWWVRRADRAAHAAAQESRSPLPERISLDDIDDQHRP